MSVITIVGAGWLGLPLAKHLALHDKVFASKRQLSEALSLNDEALQGFVADLSDPNTKITHQLSDQSPDTVIGCFPPGMRKNNGTGYVENWRRLVEACQKAHVKKVIMISTTGVYPNRPQRLNEHDSSLSQTELHSDFSEKSRTLLQAEQIVIDSGLPYVIIRCGGLFGPNRHPARFASKLKSLSQKAPANMLHLIDAINVIEFANSYLKNDIINAVSPELPSKAEFYTAAIQQARIDTELPPYSQIVDKGIDTKKLQSLGFSFRFTSPIDALNDC